MVGILHTSSIIGAYSFGSLFKQFSVGQGSQVYNMNQIRSVSHNFMHLLSTKLEGDIPG